MNFFGFFGTNAEEEENSKADDTAPCNIDEKKISSTYDSQTGKVKTSHYNPPNLFMNMKVNTPVSNLPNENKEKEPVSMEDHLKTLYQQNQENEGNPSEKESVKSASQSQSSSVHGGGISQSTIITNYISNDDLEYDDLGQDAENIKTGLGQSHINFSYGSKGNMQFNPDAYQEKKEKSQSKGIFASTANKPVKGIEVKAQNSLGISSIFSNKVSNALGMFQRNQAKSSDSSESSEEDSSQEGEGDLLDEDKDALLQAAVDEEAMNNQHEPINKTETQTKMGPSTSVKKSIIKVPEKLNISATKTETPPKAPEFSSYEDAENFLKSKIEKHQERIKVMINKQIEKWRSIQKKRVEEEKLKDKVRDLEGQLLEASKNEDYDLAAELQVEIDKVTTEIIKQENQRFKLEEKTKEVKLEFLGQIKEDIYTLIGSESKFSTEKGIYEKSEQEKLKDTKEILRAKSIRFEETSADVDARLGESNSKLDALQEKCNENAKEHIAKKVKIEEAITKCDDQIAELERLLKLKIDQKHSLEEQRQEKIKVIKKINEEYQGEIENLTDIKEKYERKKMVTEESKDVLEQDLLQLKSQEEEFDLKLKEFDTQISGFQILTKSMKSHLRSQESALENSQSLIREYESRLHGVNELSKEISKAQQDIKSTEWEIDDYRNNQAKDQQKVEEHEKMIEKLEADKKVLASSKQFKEAKRTKDLIVMKQEKRDKALNEIEEFKKIIVESELKLEKSRKVIDKLNEKRQVQEKELHEFELKVIEMLENEMNGFKAGDELFPKLPEVQESNQDDENEPNAEIEKSEGEDKKELHPKVDETELEFNQEMSTKSQEELEFIKGELELEISGYEEDISRLVAEEEFDSADSLSNLQSQCSAKLCVVNSLLSGISTPAVIVEDEPTPSPTSAAIGKLKGRVKIRRDSTEGLEEAMSEGDSDDEGEGLEDEPEVTTHHDTPINVDKKVKKSFGKLMLSKISEATPGDEDKENEEEAKEEEEEEEKVNIDTDQHRNDDSDHEDEAISEGEENKPSSTQDDCHEMVDTSKPTSIPEDTKYDQSTSYSPLPTSKIPFKTFCDGLNFEPPLLSKSVVIEKDDKQLLMSKQPEE